jgi:hypothetical protein
MFDKIAGVDVSHELAFGGTIALVMAIFAFALFAGILLFDIIIPWVVRKVLHE